MYLRHWRKYWEQEKDRMVICRVQTVSLAGVSDIWRNTCPRRYMTAAMRNGSFHSFLFYRNIGSLRWQGIRKKQFEVLKKLLNRPDLEYVVNACDAGREGETDF